jgi:PAS domain S-box-containing protein
MRWQLNAPALFMFIVAAVTTAAFSFVWRRRRARGALPLSVMIFSVSLWSFGYAIELGCPNLDVIKLLVKIEYIGIVTVAPTFLVFALEYTGRSYLITRQTLVCLAIAPAIVLALAWTNEHHELIWRNIQMDAESVAIGMTFTRGLGYWFNVVAIYGVLVAGSFILVYAVVRSPHLYRGQIGSLLMAIFAPWAINAIYLLDLFPVAGFDPTPMGFAVSTLGVTYSLYRYRLLDVMPVARAAVIENMSDGVLVFDAQSRLVDLNPTAAGVLGRPAADVIGLPVAELLARRPDLLARYGELADTHTEISLGEGDQERYFDLRISTLTDRRGNVTGHLIVLRDITERVLAEREREQLIVELDAFAHTVAHDLKNPASVAAGYAELLEDQIDQLSTERIHLFTRMIVRNSLRMNRIIDALLLLSSVRTTDNIDIQPLEMAGIVRETQDRLANVFKESNAEITLPEHWPDALGYGPWVEEIWANYLSNAAKYGGDPPRIELGAELTANGAVRFWVKDNGRGLTPDECVKLFTPFTRLQHVEVEGHGLGLSIVQRITEKLGGAVGVESALGHGSTFWFELPSVHK